MTERSHPATTDSPYALPPVPIRLRNAPDASENERVFFAGCTCSFVEKLSKKASRGPSRWWRDLIPIYLDIFSRIRFSVFLRTAAAKCTAGQVSSRASRSGARCRPRRPRRPRPPASTTCSAASTPPRRSAGPTKPLLPRSATGGLGFSWAVLEGVKVILLILVHGSSLDLRKAMLGLTQLSKSI